jgi:hypothetical protein
LAHGAGSPPGFEADKNNLCVEPEKCNFFASAVVYLIKQKSSFSLFWRHKLKKELILALMGIVCITGCGANNPAAPTIADSRDAIKTCSTVVTGETLLATQPGGALSLYSYFNLPTQLIEIHLRNASGELLNSYALPYDYSIVNATFGTNSNYYGVLTSYYGGGGSANALYRFQTTGTLTDVVDRISSDEHNGRYIQINAYTILRSYYTVTYQPWDASLGSGLNYWIWYLGPVAGLHGGRLY